MPVQENDVSNALNSALLELMPAALAKIDPGFSERFFVNKVDGRSAVVVASMHAQGRLLPQPAGQRTPEMSIFEGAPITITPVKYSGKAVFDGKTVDEVKAAKNGDLAQKTLDWAVAARRTKDLLATQHLRSTATGYDGQALYSASHPQQSKTGAGDTFSNTNEVAASVSDASVKALLTQFEETNAVDENGEKITWKASDIVATNHADYYELLVVLKSVGRAGVANNDINAIQAANPGLNVLEWRELTPVSGTTRYVHCFNSRAGENGFIYVDQQPLMPRAWFDPDAETYAYKASFSGAFGSTNWRNTNRMKTVA